MIIELNVVVTLLGAIALCVLIAGLWQLVFMLKQLRETLARSTETLTYIEGLAIKMSETLVETDVVLSDLHEVSEDYRAVKREASTVGVKLTEATTQLISHLFQK